MINPNDSKSMDRLRDSIEWSRRRMEPFRSVRIEALNQYTGAYYTHQHQNNRMPVNMLELAVNIYSRQQAARAPRVRVRPKADNLRGMAKEYEILLNHVQQEIDFTSAVRLCVTDSMFGMGIMKVGIAPEELAETASWFQDAGIPYAEPIDLDNWVQDMSAPRFEAMAFMGHRYRLPMDIISSSPLFNKDAREKVTELAISDQNRNETGDERANARTMQPDGIGGTGDALPEAVGELYDIWLPRENKLITLGTDRNGVLNKPLRVVEWEGPERGPYHLLWYNEVPSNPYPLAPVSQWLDMNRTVNNVMRKLERQAIRQKSLLAYTGNASTDAERIKNAGDGETIRVDDVSQIAKLDFGGIDQQNFAFFLSLRDQLSYIAGNLDVLGGLSAQSDTLGQDRILNQSANQRVNDMQSKVYDWVAGIIKSIGWYVWDDPMIDKTLEKKTEAGRTKSFVFSSDKKEGDYIDYNFEIEPYSMQHKTPQARMEQFISLIERAVLPMAQIAQQQGKQIDLDAIYATIAADADLPEFAKIFRDSTGVEMLQMMSGNSHREITGSNPPMTKRTYERINRPAATRQGKDRAMAMALMGKPEQPDEMAAIVRPNTG